MTTAPDPETTYLFGVIPLPNPSFNAEITSAGAKFEYNLLTIKYESSFGISKQFTHNPTWVLDNLLKKSTSKYLKPFGVAPLTLFGNTEVEAANKLDLYYGNELEVRRYGNKWDYEAEWDKKEKGLKGITIALLIGNIFGDFAIGFTMEFGKPTDGSKAKITIGAVSAVAALAIMTIHILEWGALLAREKIVQIIDTIKAITKMIAAATKSAGNTAFLVNPCLNTNILPTLNTIIEAAVKRANTLIDEGTDALNSAVPVP
jgi:hypothetical protein